MSLIDIEKFRTVPWKATHLVYQKGNGVLATGSKHIKEIKACEVIGGGRAFPFRIKYDSSRSISVTDTGMEWSNAEQAGWWCLKLSTAELQEVKQYLQPPKPATPEPVYDERVAKYNEFKVGQKVRIASCSNLRGNIFGTVTEDAGLIGEVVEVGIRGNQGIRVETKRKGKSPSRYIYQANHLLLLEEKGKGKGKGKKVMGKADHLAKLIAKRMSKIKAGDRVLIIGDIAAKYPGLTSAWTDSMYEKIGTVGTVDRAHDAFSFEVDGFIYHVLDLVKV